MRSISSPASSSASLYSSSQYIQLSKVICSPARLNVPFERPPSRIGATNDEGSSMPLVLKSGEFEFSQ
jgi:hypothetical protein